MATITATASGGTRAWSDAATWDVGVPTAADDVKLNATSGNVTIAAAAVCRSLDCADYVGTLTHNASRTLTIGDATAGAGNIALRFVDAMTYTKGDQASSKLVFISTSTTQQTITIGTKIVGNVDVNGVGSSYVLGSNMVSGGLFPLLNILNGTLATGIYNIEMAKFSMTGASTINLGTGIHEFDARGTVWSVTGGSVIAGTSTIKISDQAYFSKTFVGGSQTYHKVWKTGGDGDLTIMGSNTFAEFKDRDNSIPDDHSLLFEAGTINTFGEFMVSGSSAATRVTIDTAAGSTATHTLVKTGGGVVSCDFLDITQSVATPALTWYAGSNSIDNQ